MRADWRLATDDWRPTSSVYDIPMSFTRRAAALALVAAAAIASGATNRPQVARPVPPLAEPSSPPTERVQRSANAGIKVRPLLVDGSLFGDSPAGDVRPPTR